MKHSKLFQRGGLIIFSVLLLGLCSCDIGLSPEEVVAQFNVALKNGDVDTAVEFYDPLTRIQLEAGEAIGDAIFGGAFSAVAESFVGLSMAVEYANYEFVITGSTLTDETHATVAEDIYISGTYSFSSSLELVKIKGAWLISDSTFYS